MKQYVHKVLKTAGISISAVFLCMNAHAAEQQDEQGPIPAPIAQTQDGTVIREAADRDSIWTFSFENDFFSGEDDGYSNGVRVGYLSPENNVPDFVERGADLIPFFPDDGYRRWHAELGQNIYTPSNTNLTNPDPNDRPYAGWLYGSVGVTAENGKTLDNLQFTLGMVGPASGAEQTQKFVHENIMGDDPKGWDYQLKNEVGAMVSYEHKWRSLYEFSPFGYGFDVTPSFGTNLGNVYTDASVGAVVRFGFDLPADYGPPLIRPSIPGSDFFIPSQSFGWYLFAGANGRAVGRNIFLDGNTFRSSRSVDKEPLVGDFQAGIAFTFDDMRLAYTHVIRSREFETQQENDEFGALTLSVRF